MCRTCAGPPSEHRVGGTERVSGGNPSCPRSLGATRGSGLPQPGTAIAIRGHRHRRWLVSTVRRRPSDRYGGQGLDGVGPRAPFRVVHRLSPGVTAVGQVAARHPAARHPAAECKRATRSRRRSKRPRGSREQIRLSSSTHRQGGKEGSRTSCRRLDPRTIHTCRARVEDDPGRYRPRARRPRPPLRRPTGRASDPRRRS